MADWKLLTDQFLEVLKSETQDYLTGHQEDVLVLGKETCEAILKSSLLSQLPIPEISEGMSDADIQVIQKILARRDELFVLVSKAEKENSLRVAKLNADALAVAGKMGTWLLGAGVTILINAL
jgi:hypothetical protein